MTAALHDHGLVNGVVVARNEATGRALARQYGYEWTRRLGARRPTLLVNATPVGMAPDADHLRRPLPFPSGCASSGRTRSSTSSRSPPTPR